jgi:glyoxylase-like metal-dependent hydrolase (beta-lactamase superfamily II)
MQNFVYLLGPADGDEAIVVDPAWDVQAIHEQLVRDNRRLIGAVASHCHHDHINGLPELLKAKDIPVYVQTAEWDFSPELRNFGDAIRRVSSGQVLEVGTLSLRFVHTPGHTPGSQCLLYHSALVSGDTIFVNACGRCDLRGGDPEAMYRTISQVLMRMPDDTILLPGHDYGDVPVSTIGREKKFNPYFQYSDLASFLERRMRPRR